METTKSRHAFAATYLLYCFFLLTAVFVFSLLGNIPLAETVARNWPLTAILATIPLYNNLSPLKCLALAMPLLIGTMAAQSYIAYDLKSYNPDHPLSTINIILAIVFYVAIAHTASLAATTLTRHPAGRHRWLTFIWDNPTQGADGAGDKKQARGDA